MIKQHIYSVFMYNCIYKPLNIKKQNNKRNVQKDLATRLTRPNHFFSEIFSFWTKKQALIAAP